MSLNDLILFTVIFGSTALAVLFPYLGTGFEPYILYFMMCVLFLSFMKIDFQVLLDTSAAALIRLGRLTAIKLIVLPALLYLVASVLLPDYGYQSCYFPVFPPGWWRLLLQIFSTRMWRKFFA